MLDFNIGLNEKIDLINSADLNERINYLDDLIDIINQFTFYQEKDCHTLGSRIIDCITGLRSSRFIESDTDMKLLDASLIIAKKINIDKRILKQLLSEQLYYSNFIIERYNKIEIEKAIEQLEND